MDYKESLQMLDTEFEMRGNLAQKEPGILEEWEKDDHYHKILDKNKDHKPFVLHDGPPYANGNLHAGTAMNRIIKDIIVSSKFGNFYERRRVIEVGLNANGKRALTFHVEIYY